MNDTSFPPLFEAPHPIHDDGTIGASLYISDHAGLAQTQRPVDAQYIDFFTNIDAKIADLAASTQNLELAQWITSLGGMNKLLEVHNNDFFNQEERRFSNFYIQFTDSQNYSNWQEQYPSYGFSIELVSGDCSHLPDALQEVYRLGAIWLFGIPCSGYFYHPDNVRNALEEKYLGEYISDDWYKRLNFPLEELKVFYTDSGCWLMYDQEENVYCGGVECGDFYKSSKKLPEVISIVFSMLMKGEARLSIESFAPK